MYVRMYVHVYVYVCMSVAVELEFREGDCNMYLRTYVRMGCCHSD